MKKNATTKTSSNNNIHHNNATGAIQSFTYNQDKNCIAIATSTGYRIRTMPSLSQNHEKEEVNHRHVKVHQVTYPPPQQQQQQQRHQQPPNHIPTNDRSTTITTTTSNNSSSYPSNNSNNTATGISHVQILHSTSVICVVKRKTPRTLSILHAKSAYVLMEIPFTNAIRRIEMNLKSLLVLTADGTLHVFGLENGGGAGGGGDKKGSSDISTGNNDGGRGGSGIDFIQSISLLHESESTRMMTADGTKTNGAFFDLSTHLFSKSEKESFDNEQQQKSPTKQKQNLSSSSWFVTKSNKGVGYVSVYKTSIKAIYMTKNNYCTKIITGAATNTTNTTTTTKIKPKIVKEYKESIQLVATVQAHDNTITRIAIGGAAATSGRNCSDKVFATTSLKVRISTIHCISFYSLSSHLLLRISPFYSFS